MVGDATPKNKNNGSRTMRDKNTNPLTKAFGASILFAFASQLVACGGTTDDTSAAAPGVKQLTEGPVTGIPSPYDESITVYRGSLMQHHRWMICAGGHLRRRPLGRGSDRPIPSLTAVTSRVIPRPLYGGARTSPFPRTVFTLMFGRPRMRIKSPSWSGFTVVHT